mmetsp:Transcript_37684/g.104071  ORF Transcript_37684/g.104071 Transcript_37684/m.104071 type:complete len:254 (-) Transcript_37684:830-1591(-)
MVRAVALAAVAPHPRGELVVIDAAVGGVALGVRPQRAALARKHAPRRCLAFGCAEVGGALVAAAHAREGPRFLCVAFVAPRVAARHAVHALRQGRAALRRRGVLGVAADVAPVATAGAPARRVGGERRHRPDGTSIQLADRWAWFSARLCSQARAAVGWTTMAAQRALRRRPPDSARLGVSGPGAVRARVWRVWRVCGASGVCVCGACVACVCGVRVCVCVARASVRSASAAPHSNSSPVGCSASSSCCETPW